MKIVTTADWHLRNDDPYGDTDDNHVNEFLKHRYEVCKKIIGFAEKLDAQLVVAGDVFNARLVDGISLAYGARLAAQLPRLRQAIVIEGNHGFESREGTTGTISHWKHVLSDNVHIVTYPKVVVAEEIEYHCIPGSSNSDVNFVTIVKELMKQSAGCATKILVYHGTIVGAEFDSGSVATTGVPLTKLKKLADSYYDYVVCGDLHRHQFLADNIWYTGSPLQSSLKDLDVEKGVQVIDTQKKTVKFKTVSGPVFRRYNWTMGEKIAKELKSPENYPEEMKNAYVVINVDGRQENFNAKKIDVVVERLKNAGAIKTFVQKRFESSDSDRKFIDRGLSMRESMEAWVDQNPEAIPAEKDDVVRAGISYLGHAA